ncbi:hypothetical protein J2X02_003072 [Pseudoxanthomonas japonensis]|uniref:hypothetical protein n=1 Tax=Pseudoxanthomonas japonensis TaxID=69284 RepID=UPI00285C99D5|nr:hypothetical protein [Pseudoxanthomonas japonensis]MDR7070207.1 hypothetical protein [Pseudoxanthomonas japonensis]
MIRTFVFALSTALLLVACSKGGDANGDATKSSALWGQNLKLNATGHPKAEVSAKGDFIVGGKPVPVTDAQRALLVTYHRELGGIADAGIATGKEGAKLAGKAVGAAVKGIFSGNPDQIDKEMEAEAKKVEAEAMKICDRLPGLYKAQQDLAVALPAFEPYAGMELDDIQQCRSSHDDSYEAGKDVGRVVGQAVKATQANAAQEADAAAAEPVPAPTP